MRNYLSVEEALIKTKQTCKVCNQQIHQIPDKEGPVKFYPHHELTHGTKAFSIGYAVVKHPGGLCYYHLKKKQGFINGLTDFEKVKLQTGRALKDG